MKIEYVLRAIAGFTCGILFSLFMSDGLKYESCVSNHPKKEECLPLLMPSKSEKESKV